MDATRVLIAQHRAIETLFEEAELETRPRGRASAVSRLAEELIAHIAAEEAVFYPAARRVLDGDVGSSGRSRENTSAAPASAWSKPDGTSEAAVATWSKPDQRLLGCDRALRAGGRLLRFGLRRILETGVTEACFGERMRALRALFAKHVRDEEAQLFPCVARAVSKAQLETWGVEILASRPPVWIVTTEGRPLKHSGGQWGRRGQVSLPASSRG